MFPVLLDLHGKTVVVVGAGAVGRRKAVAASAAGAAVTLIDPLGSRETAVPRLCVLETEYHSAHIAGAALVFACAPAAVNARVVADCRARGIWVNTASDPAAGDFVLPAVHRAGGLTVAVGTDGAAPALARRVRDRLAPEFDAAFAEWVELLGEMRERALATIADADRRRNLLDALADWPWLNRLRVEGVDAVRAAMRAAVSPK